MAQTVGALITAMPPPLEMGGVCAPAGASSSAPRAAGSAPRHQAAGRYPRGLTLRGGKSARA